MEREILYRGAEFTIAFAREKKGESPGSTFIDSLSLVDKVKLYALIKFAGDVGNFRNPEKFGDLENGLFEFKSGQVRMPFTYSKSSRKLIIVTHGFIKKRDKAPKEEIARAWRILEEDGAQTKLAIVKKATR